MIKINKDLALTCFAYLYFGIGLTVQRIGIKAGLGLWPTIVIFGTSVLFFVIVMFTSMQKVKDKLTNPHIKE